MLSLLSSLPNEQDFAINVCTLMSNEAKHTLKIDKCPKLLEILLSHAGVFNHCKYLLIRVYYFVIFIMLSTMFFSDSTREMFSEFYSKIRKNSLHGFWKDCLVDKQEILDLSYEDYFAANSDKMENDGEVITSLKEFCLSRKGSTEDDDLIFAEETDLTNLNFLNLGRGLGTHDYIGQRILQITSILRNLSFNDENIPLLSNNRTFIRFLVMIANVRWGNLHHMGLDMLGNIATEVALSDPISDYLTRCLLSTISEGLESCDRGVIISSLEILSKLCQKPNNEDYIHRCMSQKVIMIKFSF